MAEIGLSTPMLASGQVPGFSPITGTTDPNATARPVEAITLSTIHAMLTRVLEQTYALWQAQASTSYALQELRHTISVLQENTNVHERLRRIEDVTETCKAHRTSQGSFLPHNVPEPSTHNVGEILDSDPPANSRPIPRPKIPKPNHIGSKLQGPGICIQDSENDNKNAEEKAKLPKPQPMPYPSMVKEDKDQSLDVFGYTSLTIPVDVPSVRIGIAFEDTSRAGKKLLGTENESLIPSSSNESSSVTARSNQNTAQEPASKNAFVSQENVASQQQYSTEHERGGALTGHEKRITSLEEGLAHLCTRFDNKQQLPFVQESVPRATDEASNLQLTDLTSLVERVSAVCDEKKVPIEEQWMEKLHWREENARLMQELITTTSWLVDDRSRKEEQENNRFESILEEIQRQTVEQQGIFSQVSESWRADNSRQYEEIINAVRATANEQIPYNIQGYLDEFSKGLGTEVRLLLGEVGKLREERRNIQHELGYLMTVRSAFRPGGQFDRPPGYTSPPHEWPSPAGIPLPESPQPHSGWYSIPMFARRRRQAPSPESQPVQHTLWSNWRPNPLLTPNLSPVEPTLSYHGDGGLGLFGPPSPISLHRDLPLPSVDSEPTFLVPNHGSLFGPRSPPGSYRDLHM